MNILAICKLWGKRGKRKKASRSRGED